MFFFNIYDYKAGRNTSVMKVINSQVGRMQLHLVPEDKSEQMSFICSLGRFPATLSHWHSFKVSLCEGHSFFALHTVFYHLSFLWNNVGEVARNSSTTWMTTAESCPCCWLSGKLLSLCMSQLNKLVTYLGCLLSWPWTPNRKATILLSLLRDLSYKLTQTLLSSKTLTLYAIELWASED